MVETNGMKYVLKIIARVTVNWPWRLKYYGVLGIVLMPKKIGWRNNGQWIIVWLKGNGNSSKQSNGQCCTVANSSWQKIENCRRTSAKIKYTAFWVFVETYPDQLLILKNKYGRHFRVLWSCTRGFYFNEFCSVVYCFVSQTSEHKIGKYGWLEYLHKLNRFENIQRHERSSDETYYRIQ